MIKPISVTSKAMFSAYSWGDFIKFCLAILIPYYGYVGWKYYRHDFREWISSFGQKKPLPNAASEEDDDPSDLYSVRHYELDPARSAQPAQGTSPAPAAATDNPTLHPADTTTAEPDLAGVALDEDEAPAYYVPIQVETERMEERSISDVLKAAQRLSANKEGVLAPTDPNDDEAANLADVINQQQGKKALSGIAFNR